MPLAEEYRRRLRPDGRGRRYDRTALEAQLGKLRQGVARLIDSSAEGLLEKHEFEPRMARLRHRIVHIEAQGQQLADEQALPTALQLMIDRLEECTAPFHQRLATLD
jgi:site-specific DNA recombinase